MNHDRSLRFWFLGHKSLETGTYEYDYVNVSGGIYFTWWNITPGKMLRIKRERTRGNFNYTLLLTAAFQVPAKYWHTSFVARANLPHKNSYQLSLATSVETPLGLAMLLSNNTRNATCVGEANAIHRVELAQLMAIGPHHCKQYSTAVGYCSLVGASSLFCQNFLQFTLIIRNMVDIWVLAEVLQRGWFCLWEGFSRRFMRSALLFCGSSCYWFIRAVIATITWA